MGRPRLYHTPEEQRIANRSKSQKHYHSNKNTIQSRRKAKYRKNKSKTTVVVATSESTKKRLASADGYPEQRHLAYWNDRVARLNVKFNKVINNNAPNFVETLISAFFTSACDKDVLRDGILSVSRHQKFIHRYEDEILQLGGMSSEWKEAHQLSNKVGEVVRWVEEALCLAMVDPEELLALHTTKRLMYQRT